MLSAAPFLELSTDPTHLDTLVLSLEHFQKLIWAVDTIFHVEGVNSDTNIGCHPFQPQLQLDDLSCSVTNLQIHIQKLGCSIVKDSPTQVFLLMTKSSASW